MFLHVGIFHVPPRFAVFLFRIVILPHQIAVGVRDFLQTAVIHFRIAFGPADVLGHFAGTAVNLPAHTMQVHPVFIHEVDAEIIILISGHPTLPGAERHSALRGHPGEPEEHIQVMHMLLDDMIPGQPGPVHPIADHIFHLRPFGTGLPVP